MRKLVATLATAATLSILPAGSALAYDGGDGSYSSDNNRDYSNNVSSSSDDSSAYAANVNKSVSYEALYYVKYSADYSAWVKAMQDHSRDFNRDQSFSESSSSQFDFPSFMNDHGNYGNNSGYDNGGDWSEN
jgi:hypothetical protein